MFMRTGAGFVRLIGPRAATGPGRNPALPALVSMRTRQPNPESAGEIPLRRLVKEVLRMRPSRIVAGEMREEEYLDLSQSTRSTTGETNT